MSVDEQSMSGAAAPESEAASEPEVPDRSRLKRALRVARRVYLIALASAIIWLAVSHRNEIVDLFTDVRPGFMVAAGLASFGMIVLSSLLWQSSLHMLGQRVSLKAAVVATARSLPARYVPLGVTYAASRVTLLAAATGVRIAPLSATAVLEMVISTSIALAVGISVLAATGTLAASTGWLLTALIAAVVALTPLPAAPAVSAALARRSINVKITRRGYLRVLASSAAYWIWASATFALYLQAFAAADDVGAVEAAGAFMVAWAIGFLAVFAPQGIGVAELGLVALLAAEDRSGVAIATAFAGYRVLLACRDAVAAMAGEIIASRRARRGSAQTDST